MLSILSAVSAETIIGIVAIIVIVISSGIIIATAVRNYLLHKKAVLETEQNNGFEDESQIQEIDSEQKEVEQETTDPTITADDEKSAAQTQDIEGEFAISENDVVQEIEYENQNAADENSTKLDVEDIVDNLMNKAE